jgi:hypothetical protein
MQRLKSTRRAQRFLSARSRIHNHFSFAVIASPQLNIARLVAGLSAPGARSSEYQPRFDPHSDVVADRKP